MWWWIGGGVVVGAQKGECANNICNCRGISVSNFQLQTPPSGSHLQEILYSGGAVGGGEGAGTGIWTTTVLCLTGRRKNWKPTVETKPLVMPTSSVGDRDRSASPPSGGSAVVVVVVVAAAVAIAAVGSRIVCVSCVGWRIWCVCVP